MDPTANRHVEAREASRGTVLLVDDDPGILRMLALMLSDAFEVTMAASAASAVARVRAGERFDLVLSDDTMPGMSGAGLYAAIRAIDPSQARRLAFVTASAREEIVEGVPQLVKPVTRAELVAFVHACMAREPS